MPRGSKPGERRGGRQRGTPNKATVAKTAALKAASADPTITPLQFLLGVMRDPTSPTDLRIQVARAAAPLVYGKLGTASPAGAVGRVAAVEREGFTVDIGEAKELRNIQRRLGALLRKRYGQNGGGPLTAAETAEESELRALISTKSAALVSPPGYGPKDAMEDNNRLHQLHCKRLSPPSCGSGELKGADDEEEAFLTARLAAYRPTPEGRGRRRMWELELKGIGGRLTLDEQKELDQIALLYPEPPRKSELERFPLDMGH